MVDKVAYDRVRRVCPDCNFIQFIDPKVGAAVMAHQDGKILLVRRALKPAKGAWCFPGGFIDSGETPQQAAIRECEEESGYRVELDRLIDVYSYEDFRGSGVMIIYLGHIVGGEPQAGSDTDALGLFGPEELPEIAFDTNKQAIELWLAGKI
jgi:ADP-ribose pyrophosphatase YjhB (NUDIX family)